MGPRAGRGWGFVRTVGSLWFAACLLAVLMVAMACATVYESMHGTPQALFVFYQSPWFAALLGLFALNVAAAVVVRFPWSRRQIGFLATHAGLLVILAGALITFRYAIDGQIGLFEGQTATAVTLRGVDSLSIANRVDGASSATELNARAYRGFSEVDNPPAESLRLGAVQVKIEKFLPHSEVREVMVDDNPRSNPAVRLRLNSPAGHAMGHSPHGGGTHEHWLTTGRPQMLGTFPAELLVAKDAAEWDRMLNGTPEDAEGSDGVVRAEYEGQSFEFGLAAATEQSQSLGDTGVSLRVLRYLPHATVGGGGLVNVSNRPENPAVEVEVTGAEGSVRKFAFAKFPDFDSMHEQASGPSVKLTFVAPQQAASGGTPVEVLFGPGGALAVRFTPSGGTAEVRTVALSQPIETPWPGTTLTVLERLERARKELRVESAELMKDESPVPALKVAVSDGTSTAEMWVQKFRPQPVSVNGVPYELMFSNKQVDLGFQLTLDKFTIGYYPGGRRPRSFESLVTISDPGAGGSMTRSISMNQPVQHGGYTFFQSSYRADGQRMASFLSVSRDPGKWVVYAGYALTIVGMFMVLAQRMAARKRQTAVHLPIGTGTCETGSGSMPFRANAGLSHKRESVGNGAVKVRESAPVASSERGL